jgi:hypothetical protein
MASRCYRTPLRDGYTAPPATSSREVTELTIYDQNSTDYDTINSTDEELIEISSPPILIFKFNLLKTIESMPNNTSPLDELYPEPEMIDEKALLELYKQLNGGLENGHVWTPAEVLSGEKFDTAISIPGYYQEPTWTQELMRMGIEDVEEELAITFNYQKMMDVLGKEIRIGDLIQTFRGKLYRVMDAYVADEIIGWKYLHFHVICRKPKGLDNLILPEGALPVPRTSNG